MLSFIRNNSHFIIVGLICVAMWGLNTRNDQLTATNERLKTIADGKDKQISILHAQSDELAAGLRSLGVQMARNNEILAQAQQEKEQSEKETRERLEKIEAALADDPHAAAPLPPAAVDELRTAEESARGGLSTHSNTGGTAAAQSNR